MSQEVLLYTQDLPVAIQEVESLGGRVTQQLTNVVIVANLPESVNPESLTHTTTVAPSDLDHVSQIAANAWASLKNKRESQAPSPAEGLPWDAPGFQPPRKVQEELQSLHADVAESTGTSTSLYMIGSIAVGVIIVSGQTDLNFSDAERQKVIQEVQEGLGFLANAEPRANVNFVYDIRLIDVTATPGSTSDYESAESPWRNAALQQMGFSASRQGSIDYVQQLRRDKGTNWAYVAYFTKYPLHHFAYAVDEKVCMEYSNDGWGSDLINRVFAHESCHIFGAADEYGSCACGGSYGYLSVPNNNCVNCSGTHVSCLMERNELTMCQWTRGQIGWDDRLLRPIQQPTPPTPPNASISAVARKPENLDLFITGNDGRVYTSWWFAGSDWSGINDNWRSIGGIFPPGAPVSAVARKPENLDLFITGNDGRVYTSWWFAGSDWSGINDNWRSIGGIFPPGAPVSAVARKPENLDLFITGNDGRIYTSWWFAGSDWSGINDNWRPIGGFFPVGAPVSAVARQPGILDLFVVGNDGRVYTSWFVEGVSDWSGINDSWRPIGGFFPVGAPVSAVARQPGILDLFVVGNDGRVYTSWFVEGVSDWSGINDSWRPIGGFFPVGAPVSAVARQPGILDLFVVGNDGRVYTSWFVEGVSDWSGINDSWRPIGGFFPVPH
jgi:hypothetical protein